MREREGAPEAGLSADEHLALALADATGRHLGNLLLLVVEAVARTHPDMLREALARVFDLTLYEERARKAANDCRGVQDQVRSLRAELRELRNEINGLRGGPEPPEKEEK